MCLCRKLVLIFVIFIGITRTSRNLLHKKIRANVSTFLKRNDLTLFQLSYHRDDYRFEKDIKSENINYNTILLLFTDVR